MVSIQHIRSRIFRNAYDTVQGQHTHFKRLVFRINENEFLRNGFCYASESLCRTQRNPRKDSDTGKSRTTAERLDCYGNILAGHGGDKALYICHDMQFKYRQI